MTMTVCRRYQAAVCTGIAAIAMLAAAPVWGAPVFKLADDSTIVVRGVVDGVQSYKKDAFLVFTITPREVLKGPATVGTPITLVEERVFGSEEPYFEKGAETLVFAVPMPSYSYYREALPAGSHFKWTERLDTAKDIAGLGDPAVSDAVTRYFSVVGDTNATARHLAALLASPVPRLRADALFTIQGRPAIATALDTEALAGLQPFLLDENASVAERGALLVGLARAKAPGVAALASVAIDGGGPLRAAGVDALVTIGKPPPEAKLLAWSASEDPAVRLAAVRGLVRLSSRPARDRVAAIVATDPVAEVRMAAIEALGTAGDPDGVAVLAKVMHGEDRREIVAASKSLSQIGGPEAVHALAEVLRDGNVIAQTAAVFALAQSSQAEAAAILEQQHTTHPNEKVRNAIGLALGESGHHH